MSRKVDTSKKLSHEDALYLSQRGRLTAEQEEEHGIKPNPLGGTPADAGAPTGDVGGTADTGAAGTGAPSPEDIANAGAASRYDEMERADLLAELERRGLPKKGKVDDLRQRLVEDDNKES